MPMFGSLYAGLNPYLSQSGGEANPPAQPQPGAPLPGSTPSYVPPASPAGTTPTGAFGGLSTGRVIAGMVGDALQTTAGGHATFMPFAEQRQQESQLFARQAQQQALETTRQMQVAQWKHDHPDDDDFTRTMRAAGIDPASPQGRIMYLTRANTVAQGMNALPQVMTIPGAGTFAVPRGAAANAPPSDAATPPGEAIARLRSNPHEAAKFDEIFGAGASQRYLTGGAAQGASVPFQP